MAKLNNLVAFRKWQAEDIRVTVGHNRAVERNGADTSCYLHGKRIVKLMRSEDVPTGTLLLDHCQYMTTTTRSAVQDFLCGLGVPYPGVSFAKGKFTARIFDSGWRHTEGPTLAFSVTLDSNGLIVELSDGIPSKEVA